MANESQINIGLSADEAVQAINNAYDIDNHIKYLAGTTPEKLKFILVTPGGSESPYFKVEAIDITTCKGDVVIPPYWKHSGNWFPVQVIDTDAFMVTGAVLAPITSIVIPETITHINARAFAYGSTLKSVTIKGKNLEYIDPNAFYSIGRLKELILEMSLPNSLAVANGIPISLSDKIYVPASNLSAYKVLLQSIANKIFPIPETKYGSSDGVDLQILWEEN